ncbi:MAG: TIGR02996 domain-containing protein [Gemmataceae bacterium]|nr:TIGR02996 domain-containing protein [Planctomycetia bacterium]MBX3399965.1 TIGR02996 domain-containing protein [Gemmataceae bacterium]
MTELDEREAFLRAIFDSPDDDAPRLVYADWLEERGEEIAAKAIRLSIDWFRATGVRSGHLKADSERFQAEHVSILNGIIGVVRWPIAEPNFGFIDLATGWLHDSHELRWKAARSPWWFRSTILLLRGSGCRIVDAVPFDAIEQTPAFRKVIELHAPGDQVPVVGAATDASGSVTEEIALETRIVPIITTAGVEALARHRFARRLTLLDLRNNQLGNDALRALARSPYLENLRQLTIAEGNNFRGRVWQLLVDRFGEDAVS